MCREWALVQQKFLCRAVKKVLVWDGISANDEATMLVFTGTQAQQPTKQSI